MKLDLKFSPKTIVPDLGSGLTVALVSIPEGMAYAMVAGVNLPMLVDFCFHRDVSPSDAAERAVSRGLAAIKPLGL